MMVLLMPSSIMTTKIQVWTRLWMICNLKLVLYQTLPVDYQRAKKVVSDSPGLVDFAIGLVNFVFNLPDGQVIFLSNSNKGRTVKSILQVKTILGLVEMTFGLVNASFSLPKWQAVKMIFFAP